jgi:hypothetical protein
MNEVVRSAVKAGVSNVDQNVLIISPQFFSTRYNTGQYTARQLAWDDVNGWEAGDPANHPAGTTVTSIDVLDSIVASLVNASGYPSMRNITIVGHGGGGQLIQRYATVGKVCRESRISGSLAYFHDHRISLLKKPSTSATSTPIPPLPPILPVIDPHRTVKPCPINRLARCTILGDTVLSELTQIDAV